MELPTWDIDQASIAGEGEKLNYDADKTDPWLMLAEVCCRDWTRLALCPSVQSSVRACL